MCLHFWCDYKRSTNFCYFLPIGFYTMVKGFNCAESQGKGSLTNFSVLFVSTAMSLFECIMNKVLSWN